MGPCNIQGARSMREIFVLAGMMIALAVVAARYADHSGRGSTNPPSAATLAPPPAAAPVAQNQSGTTVSIQRDIRGHFAVTGRVNGRPMGFMVDTGATAVALRASDAAMLGIHPMPRDFVAQVQTANGSVRAAQAQLSMVEIGAVTVHEVKALVLPDEALSENLLGMSFLSRLRRFEYDSGRLILEQ
jgi:aspartyl protease family protein